MFLYSFGFSLNCDDYVRSHEEEQYIKDKIEFLDTSEGYIFRSELSQFLSTDVGLCWLKTDTGKKWLNTETAVIWMSQYKYNSWLNSDEAVNFVTTEKGYNAMDKVTKKINIKELNYIYEKKTIKSIKKYYDLKTNNLY